jgi:hypothetical protein
MLPPGLVSVLQCGIDENAAELPALELNVAKEQFDRLSQPIGALASERFHQDLGVCSIEAQLLAVIKDDNRLVVFAVFNAHDLLANRAAFEIGGLKKI